MTDFDWKSAICKVTTLSRLWWQRWCSDFFPAAINMLLNVMWLKYSIIMSLWASGLRNCEIHFKSGSQSWWQTLRIQVWWEKSKKKKKEIIKFRRWRGTQPSWFIFLGLFQNLWQFMGEHLTWKWWQQPRTSGSSNISSAGDSLPPPPQLFPLVPHLASICY